MSTVFAITFLKMCCRNLSIQKLIHTSGLLAVCKIGDALKTIINHISKMSNGIIYDKTCLWYEIILQNLLIFR